MASCLSSAIDSSEHHVAETRNAINPDMSALATVSKDTEIESLLTNSQEELLNRGGGGGGGKAFIPIMSHD